MKLEGMFKNNDRFLPVFLLIDSSGSMDGYKIDTVNVAIKDMLASFRSLQNPKGIIKLAIITFSSDTILQIKPLSTIKDTDSYYLAARGNTPMGKAFSFLDELLKDDSIISNRDYAPTIVLISDGLPTDCPNFASISSNEEFKLWEDFEKLRSNPRYIVSLKLAMGIGDDVDNRILKAFIADEKIPIFKASNTQAITSFFEWVTTSVSMRSVSANPNDFVLAEMFRINDDDMEF